MSKPVRIAFLGGLGEIGRNCMAVEQDKKILLIDCGLMFPKAEHGDDIDVIIPDFTWLLERKDRIVGCVATHGHEDHVGALQYLLQDASFPLYGSALTLGLARNRIAEARLTDKTKFIEVSDNDRIKIGPFDVEFIPVTHSVPHAHAIALHTAQGVIVHSGDFKLDRNPIVGEAWDDAAFEAIAAERPIKALMCDSTNVFAPLPGRSESTLGVPLSELIASSSGMVVATTFASNVARLETVIMAANEAGREVALSGKSLWRMSDAAKGCGYLQNAPRLLTEEQGMELPRKNVVFIVTGCQGESRAALSKIARGDHPAIRLSPGDTILFSSRTIPGNETRIGWLHNQLVLQGLEVINDYNGFVHVSGHPARMELERMYQLVRPAIAVPTHGEARHLREHVLFAKNLQVPEAVEATNGAVIRLKKGAAEIVGHVPSGYLALDGSSLISTDSTVIRTRRKIRDDGFCAVSLVLDKRGKLLAPPKFSAPGSLDPEEDGELVLSMREEMEEIIARGRFEGRMDELEKKLRNIMRRTLRDELGKKPVLDVHIHRI